MSNQIVITSGAKLRDLDDVIVGTDGILSSVAFNVANGVPRLDENGKILVSQLPNSVMEFKGVWNASTNSPTLVNGTGNAGDVWLCNVAGTVNFGAGPIAFAVGDYAVYTGTVWARSSGATGTVTSVGVSRDGNALTITGSPVTTSGTINLGFSGDNTQYINGAGNLTTFPTIINSIGLTMPAAFNVSNSPLTANGTIGVSAAGYASQYIRGDGTLADFPTSGGGGSSVSYYLNGGTSQGTIGGTTYYEMSKTADTGTGVDFNKTGDGFITAFLTDAGDPALLQIPAGNWNYEIYASMSSNGGTPEMYAELYVYNGTTFTLLSTSSHEILYDGVNLNLYTFAMAVPETVLTVTDRLAIKLYADNSGGKTTTIHTQDSHLCQVITTFSTGLTALNGLTAQVQYFGTGTSGSDFNIVSSVATHTFNIPSASATARGLITTGTQTIAGSKTITGTTTFTGGPILSDTNLTYANSGYTLVLQSPTLSVNRTVTLPNGTGTLALTSDLTGGTVTSVGLSAPTGFSVSGSPVTTSGTLALSFASGYSLPTNVKQSNWDDAYTWVAAFPTQTGNNGKFLTTDGSSLSWAPNPLGTVTSVAMSVPTGLSISGSPITSSGTLAVTLASGYVIPTQTTLDGFVTLTTTQSISGAKTFTSVITNTLSSGSNIVLNKGTGPSIQFNKTNATAQGWSLSAEETSFKLYNSTTSTIPFKVNTNDNSEFLGTIIASNLSGTNTGDQSLSTLGGVVLTSPTNGEVLKYNGTNWVNGTDLNSGTVTSVAMTVPTGLSISGSPITTSGTLAVTLTAGYSIPTNASQTTWDTAYTNRITSLTVTGSSGASTLISNVLNIPTYTLSGLGGQPLATNLTSLSGLTYASTSFVKMTATGTFSLDTNTYLTTTSAASTYLPLIGGTLTGNLIYNSGDAVNWYLQGVGNGPMIRLKYNIGGTNRSGALGWMDNASSYTDVFAWTDSIIGVYVPITNTISSGANIILNKGTGPAISFNKTDATAQSWSISTDPNFRISDDTASIIPLQITLGTGAATFYSSITATSFIKVGGTSSQFLKADGSVDSNTYGTFTLPSLTSGSVLFSNGSTIAQNNSQFFWDNTNNRLGIGTSAPSVKLQVNGSGDNTYFNVTNNNGYSIADISAVGTAVSGHGVLNLGKGGTTNVVINGFGDSYFTGGNLGVGTNSPSSSYRLDVSGAVRFSSTTSTNLVLQRGSTSYGATLDFSTLTTNKWFMGLRGLSNEDFYIYNQTAAANNLILLASTGAATFNSSITATQGFFTHTSGETLTLSKGTGPSIAFNKTDTTAQSWALSGGGTSFTLYNYTASTIPFQISASTGASTFAGNIYMQSSGNPTQLLVKGTNSEFWVDSQYGGGTSRAFINRGSTSNQATLMFSTGVAITNGTAWAGSCDWSMGMANDSTNNFYIAYGDLYSSGNRAITINSSKYVGIGNSSPQYTAQITNTSANTVTDILALHNGSNAAGTGTGARLLFKLANFESSAETRKFASIEGISTSSYNEDIALVFKTKSNNSDPIERMRILGDNTVCFGKTSYDNTTTGVSIADTKTTAIVSIVTDGGTSMLWNRKTSTGDIVVIRYNGSGVGSISTNGSTTSYNITSDYRLKQDFKEFNGLSIIDKIKIYDFEWKIDKSRMFGAIAHELQEVLPIAVSGAKDAIDKDGQISAQGVDYSKVVPILVKAIQELKLEIQELKNK